MKAPAGRCNVPVHCLPEPELGLITTLGAMPCPPLVGVTGPPELAWLPMPPIPGWEGMKGPPVGAIGGCTKW